VAEEFLIKKPPANAGGFFIKNSSEGSMEKGERSNKKLLEARILTQAGKNNL